MTDSSIYLVLLPGAGETAAGYMAWHHAFSCHVVSLEYPGHGTRMDESCVTDMKDLVEDLHRSLKKQIPLHSSILLFGYSLGGLAAWSLAHQIEGTSAYHLLGLCLAACHPDRSYMVLRNDTIRYLEKSPNLTQKIRSSKLYRSFILPSIEKDIDLIRWFHGTFTSPLSAPIYAFYGSHDKLVQADRVNDWEKETCKDFHKYEFEGDHFFIQNEQFRKELMKKMREIIMYLSGCGDNDGKSMC